MQQNFNANIMHRELAITRAVRYDAKSDYIIEEDLIWARNRCLGSNTQLVCLRWTMPVVICIKKKIRGTTLPGVGLKRSPEGERVDATPFNF